MNENEEENGEQDQEAQALVPIVQDTITFNGKPLVVVRLPDMMTSQVLQISK